MTEPYSIHGRVVRSTSPITHKPTINFELIFPEDWVLLERQLNKASCGFAQLRLDALGIEELNTLDMSSITVDGGYNAVGICDESSRIS